MAVVVDDLEPGSRRQDVDERATVSVPHELWQLKLKVNIWNIQGETWIKYFN